MTPATRPCIARPPPACRPQILSLPCRHQFHEECVTQWLRFKGAGATCPNCKGTVFSPTKTASLAAAAAAAQSPALLH